MRLCSGIILTIVFVVFASCSNRDDSESDSSVQVPRVTPAVTTIPIPDSPPTIRVRLQRVKGDLVPVEFARDGELILMQDHVGNHVDVRGPFTIRRDEQGWIIRGRTSAAYRIRCRIPHGSNSRRTVKSR